MNALNVSCAICFRQINKSPSGPSLEVLTYVLQQLRCGPMLWRTFVGPTAVVPRRSTQLVRVLPQVHRSGSETILILYFIHYLVCGSPLTLDCQVHHPRFDNLESSQLVCFYPYQ